MDDALKGAETLNCELEFRTKSNEIIHLLPNATTRRDNEWNHKTAEITRFSKHEALSKPLVSSFIVTSLQALVQDILDNSLHGN